MMQVIPQHCRHNTSNSSSKQGGASLTVGAYTKDGSNVDVNANLNVNYADENKKNLPPSKAI